MSGLNITEVITLATEAMGRTTEDISNFVFRFEHFKDDTYEFTPDEMFKFAQLVAAAERNTICGLLDRLVDTYENMDRQGSAEDIRKLIQHIKK